MTSGVFESVAISSITWVRERRQRRTLGDLSELAESLSKRGQIHPIVITRERIGVVGERRWAAAKSLGWTHIAAQFQDEIDEKTLHKIELDENIKRTELPWPDRVAAIAEYHEICRAEAPSWTQEDTAEELGISQETVSRHILVAKEMHNPEIAKQTVFGGALNQAKRVVARRKADELTHIDAGRIDTHVLTADFNEWAPLYDGPKFNLIHCDFPYGINAHKHKGQAAALGIDYADTEEVYDTLCGTLRNYIDNFCSESAHMVFWFSPNVWEYTKDLLWGIRDWRFEEHPLIWVRGENEGIAPDPSRRPRRIYEMAFFGWRGDRRIIKTKANAIVAPTDRSRHPHEKSQIALQHFFEMLVDDNTRLFDPTCGSGSALRAAKILGCRSYLGLERDSAYAETARRALMVVREPSNRNAEA